MPALPAYPTRSGNRFPPGAWQAHGGVNFCVFSRDATRVDLLLYQTPVSPEPFQVISLDPERNRSFYFWHVFVEGLPVGTCYTWRMDGPKDTPATGRRFYPDRELLDPWAKAVSDLHWQRRPCVSKRSTPHQPMRGIVTPGQLALPSRARGPELEGAVIYELHVGGFTRHSSSGVAHPGTFDGLREKIPYLESLGVTHVELLPVMAFDSQDVPDSVAALGLENYWGYSTHSFWAPHPGYCVDPVHAAAEFRALVAALHEAGISVILDVAFNHTSEVGEDGPVINFRGMANDIFYHLDDADRRKYLDFTGCGNTVNCNHPLVSAFIVHCLEYWVERLGVDGFRFDLASVFARGSQGIPMADPPLPWAIESSRILSRVPVIAEAWDAAGLYHVGRFPGMAWSEWNGSFRDLMRRFVRGEPGLAAEVATRIAGSADLYADDGRKPANSINFITCHDGFTLHDLVSYDRKHNLGNGEHGRDGSDQNLSWNCGVEGSTCDPAVLRLRRRQAKNLLALLFLSRGVPMLLAGDEVLRTQHGNNNAWCQDNDTSWFDWRLPESNADMLRFTRELIAFRRRHPTLTANRFYAGAPLRPGGPLDIVWHGARLDEPPWDDPSARILAFTLADGTGCYADLHVILNMSDSPLAAPLPAVSSARRWHLAVDTAAEPPADIPPAAEQAAALQATCTVAPRSVVVLETR